MQSLTIILSLSISLCNSVFCVIILKLLLNMNIPFGLLCPLDKLIHLSL